MNDDRLHRAAATAAAVAISEIRTDGDHAVFKDAITDPADYAKVLTMTAVLMVDLAHTATEHADKTREADG